MHLDIGLPLLSELEQLCQAFWQNHNQQNHSHNQDKAITSHEQRESPDHAQHLDNANNHIEPNHSFNSRRQNQNSEPDSYLVGQQHTHDNHEMRTGQDHFSLSKECKSLSQNNNSGQESSQPLQVNNSVLGQCNKPGKISKAQWNSITDDSSFL